jgi:hypothetical protein
MSDDLSNNAPTPSVHVKQAAFKLTLLEAAAVGAYADHMTNAWEQTIQNRYPPNSSRVLSEGDKQSARDKYFYSAATSASYTKALVEKFRDEQSISARELMSDPTIYEQSIFTDRVYHAVENNIERGLKSYQARLKTKIYPEDEVRFRIAARNTILSTPYFLEAAIAEYEEMLASKPSEYEKPAQNAGKDGGWKSKLIDPDPAYVSFLKGLDMGGGSHGRG